MLHVPYTNLFVSTKNSIVSSPKSSAKNSLGLASADKGIRKPGWAVNGNVAGGVSEAFSMAVHSKPVRASVGDNHIVLLLM